MAKNHSITKRAVIKALGTMSPEERALASAESAYLALVEYVEAKLAERSCEVNAFAYYICAVGHGYKPDAFRDDFRESFADGAARELFLGQCKVYKRRAEVLIAHGIKLVDDAGEPIDTCEVGEFKGSPGGVAQKLLSSKGKGKGAQKRGGKGASNGEGEGEESDAPVVLSMMAQAENVARAMAESIKLNEKGELSSGDGVRLAHVLIATCPQVVLAMARYINTENIKRESILASQAQEKAKAQAVAAARIKADADKVAADKLTASNIAKRAANRKGGILKGDIFRAKSDAAIIQRGKRSAARA